MHVVILHNFVPPDAPPEDQDTLVEVAAVADALKRLGHRATPLACDLNLAAMQSEFLRLRPDAIFNLVESLGGSDALVYLPPAALDAFGIRYAGNRTEALFLTTHKVLAKERMRNAGLPTPLAVGSGEWGVGSGGITRGERRGARGEGRAATGATAGLSSSVYASVVENTAGQASSGTRQTVDGGQCSVDSDRHTRKTFILKGVWDQGSRGMDDSVVLRDVTPDELREKLAARAEKMQGPCFAEEFIEGREFNLSVLAGPNGPEALPPAEIVFVDFPAGKPRIVGHRAKWQEDSFEYIHTQRRFDFPAADAPLLENLQTLARRCWSLFDLRGWARVDFRVDASGQPWILEVNGNPCLSPDAGFAAACSRADISYDTAVARILADV